MNNSCQADFYQGWLIEITQTESGFRSTCLSPSRQTLNPDRFYKSSFEALVQAKRSIDHSLACHALASWIREFFEAEGLSFDEWRSLHQSITEVHV